MHKGRIVEEGPVRQVLAAPTHPYTRSLLDAAPSIELGAASAHQPEFAL
jgi:ABC-type dipeptide/oligopeptide/nickel transport system ATPase component